MLPRFHVSNHWRSAPLHIRPVRCSREVLRAYNQYWGDRLGREADPYELLPIDVELILIELGWRVGYHRALADEAYRVAGEVDAKAKAVLIARNFAPASLRFTMAHELGHILMHDVEKKRFRDPPITAADLRGEGQVRRKLDPEEREANRFAAMLLMPRKTVERQFHDRFGLEQLRIADADENVRFHLSSTDIEKIISGSKRAPSPLEFATAFAATKQFGGRHFNESMASAFGVSADAMAVQLVSLGIVTL